MGSRAVWRLWLGAAVVLLVLLQGSQLVRIEYQGFEVQLESVKKLSELEQQWTPSTRLQTQTLLPAVCHEPALPSDLQPVCASQDAASIFTALKSIANDECELCVNIACTGCF